MNLSSISTKVLTASLVLAASTGLAFAKNYKGENYKAEAMPCPAPAMLMGGFYLGGQLGYDTYWVRENINLVTAGVTSLNANPKIGAPGWLAGLFLGYGQYFDTFYLGGEVFGNWNGASQSYSITSTTGTYNNKFQANSNYGLSLLPGLRLNDTTTAYVRLGWNWANLQGKESQTVGATTTSTSKSNTSNGFQYGIGLETLLMGNWSVRGEYNHTSFTSFTSSMGTSYNPSDNQFLAGLVYHFA